MDRNTFTGLFLIMIILGGAVFFMQPNAAEMKKQQALITADSLKKANAEKAAPSNVNNTITTTPKVDSNTLKGPFGGNITGTATTSVLENDQLKLTFSNLGGKILSVQVKKEH